MVWYDVISCHGDVRSVYRRFKDGTWYGTSLVYMVWHLSDV